MDLGQTRIKTALKKIDWLSIKRMQKYFDGFILYTSKMAEYLHVPFGKWLLMEGSYDAKELPLKTEEKKKALMYSGKLDYKYGISMLLDAFMSVDDPQIELWITGGGDAENYIKECSLKDNRIRFFGFLPSRNDVLELQQKASLLINMRLPSEAASSYSFPSKLFEYMATGVPVLSFKLEGIPDEYYDKLVIVEEESIEALAEAIRKGFGDDNSMLGKREKDFIINEKNTLIQCRKIKRFILGD
jgi:glycosyltransferase involved in cell wall biosynthesis